MTPENQEETMLDYNWIYLYFGAELQNGWTTAVGEPIKSYLPTEGELLVNDGFFRLGNGVCENDFYQYQVWCMIDEESAPCRYAHENAGTELPYEDWPIYYRYPNPNFNCPM